ncbi:protein kinase domain-containing protein [Sorangium sp. So ce406]|uniref:protein kinase domain-containing protein n=1 Tax=Sorangium sp. So ce406 TaxID=3133311 RepID=UPI003F5B69C3
MDEDHEAELRVAVAEGLIPRAGAQALAREAAEAGASPLALLLARGVISEESFASLRGNIGASGAPIPPPAPPPAASNAALDDTIASPPRAPDLPEPPLFPWSARDRYQPLRLLGQGGMGTVFLARDLRLDRDVALKLVRGGEPAYVRRFIAEARSQARVSHENVCKVYEVGEVDGKAYIAMQYIDGEPLGDAAPTLTVEQKVLLVRDAAEGIHEAHRAGIIHRDIKPGNIMVERGPDGRLKSYVTDFGLARAWSEEATDTGSVAGTPQYMSPEQARGEAGKLDRRADVYGLGAALYAILTGEPPISGDNALDVLCRIGTVEPRPPRAVDPGIPRDLEAIVLKCLEKDRSARYDSARALAEDLERFLSGEAVLAGRQRPLYRLRKRLRKHRRAVALALSAFTLAAASLGWGVVARREAAERERLARRFTERVERIEAMARYSALSPLHDTRADRARIRAEMAALEAEIQRSGPVGSGPGHYALGRGFLALGDEEQGKEHLDSAWQSGFHDPRAAYALALVEGHLYRHRLLEAERIRTPELRDARKREIERQHRDPALDYLRRSAGADVPSEAYVSALLAFYEGRLEDALARLDAMDGGLPWFYEAPALRGDVLLARASQRWNRGEREGALADFEAGRRAYAAAAAAGESEPSVHEALGALEYAALVTELYGAGEVELHFDRGLQAVSRALTAAPDRAGALVLRANLLRRMAEHRVNQGGRPEDLLDQAVAGAREAMRVDPGRARARLTLGRIHHQWAEYLQQNNQDPREQLRSALDAFDGVAAAERDYDYEIDRALIHETWASYEDQVGVDSRANRGRAIDGLLTAIRLDDKLPVAWINLGMAYFMRASLPRAEDADGDLQQASAALERARAINSRHVVPYFYGGQVHRLKALRARARGGDAGVDLALAAERYRQGIALNPGFTFLHNGLGGVLIEQARDAWDRGADPYPFLDDAQRAYRSAIAAAPEQGFAYHNLGDALLERALYEQARGEDPRATLRSALDLARQAVERLPHHAPPWANLGMAFSIQAAHELDRGLDPQRSVAEALSAANEALRRNPSEALAHLVLAEARATQALWQARRGRDGAAAFEEAARAYEALLRLSPDEPRYPLSFGRSCGAWAAQLRDAGKSAEPHLARGLELAGGLLEARPDWADARALRASLTLIEAEARAAPEERRPLAEQAREDFDRALARNPNLAARWRGRADLARELATPPR